MRLKLLLTVFGMLMLTGAGTPRRPLPWVEGEVLVKFRGMARASAMSRSEQKFLSKSGARRVQAVNNKGLVHLRLAKNQSVESALEELRKDPEVEYAQPNFRYQLLATSPNDPSYSSLWGLQNTAQTIAAAPYATNNPGTAGKDIEAEEAWDLVTNCSTIPVAVLDTGVNYNHQDLTATAWNGGAPYPNHGYDFIDTDNDPMDLHGHGTHVAGTIGAAGNDGVGMNGVCWNASIMAVRVLNAAGSGTTAGIVLGINFAVANGAKVINMSLGGAGYDSSFYDAIEDAKDSGVAVIVAAGNDGLNNDTIGQATYPCNYTNTNLVCVAALDQKYSLATFSNYGPMSVDVGAPGTNIYSTWFSANNAYDTLNGTSMATPHVAGIAAMLFAYQTNYTLSDVIQAIKYGGTFTTALSGRTTTARAVSAFGSLSYINAPTGVAATVSQ